MFALAKPITWLIQAWSAALAGAENVRCAPTAACESLLVPPGGSALSGLVEPTGSSLPEKASMKAVKLATIWSLVTSKAGSARKRSIESTLPSCR